MLLLLFSLVQHSFSTRYNLLPGVTSLGEQEEDDDDSSSRSLLAWQVYNLVFNTLKFEINDFRKYSTTLIRNVILFMMTVNPQRQSQIKVTMAE